MAYLIFGTLAGAAMLLMYALEERGHWFVLGLAAAGIAATIYALLIAAWPFVAIELAWAAVAFRRWRLRYERERALASQPALAEVEVGGD